MRSVVEGASDSTLRFRSPLRALLRLDVGVLDHRLPFAELDLDEVAKLAGRRGKALEADIFEFRLNIRTVDDRAQRGVELADGGRRRPGRRDEACPGVEVEAGDAGLVHGRQVWEQRAALEARYRQCAH